MERNFLGLNSKNSITIIDEDSNSKDTVFMRGSPMQWPYSSKASELPQFMSFRTVQEERPQKTAIDHPISMPIPTSDAFDANQKAYASIVQKNFNIDVHGGNQYASTAYPMQHADPYFTHHPNEIRTHTIPNHTISVMGNPFYKSHVSSAGSNLNQHQLGGVPVMTPHFTSSGSISAVADQRNMPKPVAAPAQLTIFYGGAVNVYDDVSPEKAQAIMFLAGNGSSPNLNIATSRAQLPVGADTAHVNQSHNTMPCSRLSSPMCVTSHLGSTQSSRKSTSHLGSTQSSRKSSGKDELMAAKAVGTLVASNSQQEPAEVPTSIETEATLRPAAVPQARKASVARFLEKRKDRVITASPYNNSTSRRSPESSTTQGSNSFSFSGNSSVGFGKRNEEKRWRLAKAKIENVDEDVHTIS